MRLKNVPGSREVIGESRFVIHEPELQKGKWKEVFGNENPIHIEIGMGKSIPAYCCAPYRKWRKKSFPTYVLSVWMQRISAMYLIKRRSAGYI